MEISDQLAHGIWAGLISPRLHVSIVAPYNPKLEQYELCHAETIISEVFRTGEDDKAKEFIKSLDYDLIVKLIKEQYPDHIPFDRYRIDIYVEYNYADSENYHLIQVFLVGKDWHVEFDHYHDSDAHYELEGYFHASENTPEHDLAEDDLFLKEIKDS